MPKLHRSRGLYFKASRYLGFSAFFRRINASGAVVVMYHGFTDGGPGEGLRNHNGIHLSRSDFENQIKFLQTHYDLMGLPELVDLLGSPAQLPRRAAVITIDDGYESTYKIAFPILEKYGVPATVFVATDFVDKNRPLWPDRLEFAASNAIGTAPIELDLGDDRVVLDLRDRTVAERHLRSVTAKLKRTPIVLVGRFLDQLESVLGISLDLDKDCPDIYKPLSWDQINLMLQSGLVSVGNHTMSHPILSQCEPERIMDEIVDANRVIEARTGTPCRLFCYPNGKIADFNEHTKQVLKDLGISGAVTTERGFASRANDRYELPRFLASNNEGVDSFVAQISGMRVSMANLKGNFMRIAGARA